MKERPILFSAPMVRALLNGSKTQTRRVAKPVQHPDLGNIYTPGALVLEHEPKHVIERACPYGHPGDRLWVWEAFSGPRHQEAYAPSLWHEVDDIWYWADGNPSTGDWPKPRPSIHMPRWASRITLEITGVRVERLQDISEADAMAEGIYSNPDFNGMWTADGDTHSSKNDGPIQAYRHLWVSLNGPGSWDANPWVWVIEFKKLEALS